MKEITQHDLDRLHDQFLDMRERKQRIRREVERRYRDKIEAEIEFETRTIERAFAVALVEARERGATRKELVKVIADGTASVMRYWIELGGGEVRKRLTGSERAEERREALGVKHLYGKFYAWTVAGSEFECELVWYEGKPGLMPVGDAAITLRDEHGITTADLFDKGAQVVSAFGIKEES